MSSSSSSSVAIQPLSHGQKLFLQKLVAAHGWSDEEALQVYNQIKDNDGGGRQQQQSMDQCLATINASLKLAFGLEIRTISLYDPEQQKAIRHHAVVNADPKASFLPYKQAHELAFIRLLLEKIIAGMNDKSPLSRMDAVNLRTELTGDHANKLSIDLAEQVLDQLESEKWLTSEDDKTNQRRNKSHILIGPRTYMELTDLLTELGLERESMPQFIIHKA
uniref:Non-structural maintenance of chromosomes element 1 homolog n=1 Tax=Attheya septentrionalis TaxID=420275 RepID=A0A7S2U5Q5_9STRA